MNGANEVRASARPNGAAPAPKAARATGRGHGARRAGAAGVAAAFALLAASAGGCAKRGAAAPEGLPPTVELAVDEQVVLRSVDFDEYYVAGAGAVVSVSVLPKWLLLGGLRPGQTTLTLQRRGAASASMKVIVTSGPPRRGTEVVLAPGETRVLDVPEVLTYELRGPWVFSATLESPRAVGILAGKPGIGTLAVLGKNDSYALFRVIVRRKDE